MKTVGIKFINNKSNKTYHFLTDMDLQIGDKVTDSRYEDVMKVVDVILQDYPVFQGHTLKILNVLNWIKSTNKTARAVLITLEQAMKWYESGNEALKQVALSVYSEKELKLDYFKIQHEISKVAVYIPANKTDEFGLNSKLAFLAEYFNKGWEKTIDNDGYFLTKNAYNSSAVENVGDFCINKHLKVKYLGIVYFRRKEDLIKAYNLINNVDCKR